MNPFACLIIPLCIILVAFGIYALIFRNSPEGYEDADGFHFAENPSNTTSQDRS